MTGSESPNTFVWPEVGVTVIARPDTVVLKDALEFEYAVEEVGVKVAVNAAAPRSTGIQSQVAVADDVTTASQPEIDDPFSMKFTLPARDVVALMRLVTRYCGEADANANEIFVDA